MKTIANYNKCSIGGGSKFKVGGGGEPLALYESGGGGRNIKPEKVGGGARPPFPLPMCLHQIRK